MPKKRDLDTAQENKILKLWGASLTISSLPNVTIRADSTVSNPSVPSYLPKRGVALPTQAKEIDADYTIRKELGQGGMGRVFSAVQKSLNRVVAVKTLREDCSTDSENRRRFLAEALVTGDLDHPISFRFTSWASTRSACPSTP